MSGVSRGATANLHPAYAFGVFLGLACACGSAIAGQRNPVDTSFADAATLSGYLLGSDNAWDADYDRIQNWKKTNQIPISIGANHWWHLDRDDRIYGDGYGVPGERGTYYYYIAVDPSLKLGQEHFVNEIGFHNQTRFRDAGDKLRSFYTDTIWTYETYAFAKTDLGTVKAGQIVQQFGISWDNSWWEGVPYFDGYRFNPAWGISWENTWKPHTGFTVGTAFQYFIADDRVSGAIAGANAEASPPLDERNTFNARVVPQWNLNSETTISLGGSVLTREIRAPAGIDVSSRQTAFETDVTFTWRNLSVWGQYTASRGAITPVRYVSGGPSDRQSSVEAGVNYKIGPVAAHINYSYGWDDDPSGHQFIFNPGLVIAVSKSITAYAEYVKWDVVNSAGVTSKYDDGFELILAWNY
jgi:hypothetical protein